MNPTPGRRPHLASLLADFQRHGDQTAVVYHHDLRHYRVSYADLAHTAGRFAAELQRRNIVKGDRVLIWGENGAPWMAAFFGCLLRGVLAVPLDAASPPAFARRVADEVGARLCAGSTEQLSHFDGELPGIDFDRFHEVLPEAPETLPISDLAETDPFQIVFTSGTTGEPKGIVHTHRNVLASLGPIETEMQKYLKYERIFHPLRFLHTLPLSHVFGQFMGIWIPALLAAEVHFESRLVAAGLLQDIRRSRVSVLAAVPRVLDILRSHLLVKYPDLDRRIQAAKGSSPWKRWWLFRDVHRSFGFKFWSFVCGGATLPSDLEQFWGALGFAVIQGYGMTETAALVSLNHPFRQARGSIGKVLPGREVRLREDGEILVRGETVSNAVWEGGELRRRESEWLETGDLASQDEAGNLRYRGRKKDVIVTSGGLNIYPEDLEAALSKQPNVKACAIVETQGRTGPEPMAALVLRGAGDPAAIVHAANRELAEYQQIRRWQLWPEPDLPRTSTGKVIRRDVARLLAPSVQGGAPAGNTLAAIVHNISGEDVTALGDEALLSEDLHLDSLGRVELLSAMEAQFGLSIDDAAWQQIKTLGELRLLLQQNTTAAPGPAVEAAAPRGEHIYPLWPWSRAQRFLRSVFIELVMRPLVRLLAAPRVESLLDREPETRVLIVCNHVTAYDVPLILYSLPRSMRSNVAVAMGGELLRDLRAGRGQGSWFVNLVAPAGYWLATALFNVFPLPQQGGFRESFAHAGRAMDAGFHVLVFPEGRRSPDGALHSFQNGAGLLWKELHTPALPVFLGGVGQIKAERAGWFRSGRIVIRVGSLEELEQQTEPLEASQQLRQAVAALSQPPTTQA
ncbi:MAG: AMP-binding protein [Bryobacteraceae bacterium]